LSPQPSGSSIVLGRVSVAIFGRWEGCVRQDMRWCNDFVTVKDRAHGLNSICRC
jgi:hypothetical protein